MFHCTLDHCYLYSYRVILDQQEQRESLDLLDQL